MLHPVALPTHFYNAHHLVPLCVVDHSRAHSLMDDGLHHPYWSPELAAPSQTGLLKTRDINHWSCQRSHRLFDLGHAGLYDLADEIAEETEDCYHLHLLGWRLVSAKLFIGAFLGAN